MATVIRLGLSTIVGVIVTLGLFYLMQYLIQGADSALTDDKIGNLVDFVRVKQEQEVETKQRKPKKPPPLMSLHPTCRHRILTLMLIMLGSICRTLICR